MATIPTGYAQANWFFTGTGAPTGAQVTLGLDVGALVGDEDQLPEALWNAWDSTIHLQLSGGIILEKCVVKFGPNDVGPFYEYVDTANGGAAGVSDSPNVAMLVRKQSLLGGRRNRGRMYIPGVSQSDVGEDGTLVGASLIAFQTAMDDFLTEIEATGCTPVLLHSESLGVLAPTPMTSFSVQSLVATQRRRLRR